MKIKQLPSPEQHMIGKEVYLPETWYGMPLYGPKGSKNNPFCKIKKILYGKQGEQPFVLLEDNSIWGVTFVRIK